ncbi:hypothetical protein PC114_g10113 [Phytophthora cactorum]|nr:hypothetical protein PC114_g10113 [Phytophthora cactorum]
MQLEATLATTSSITTVSRYLYEMERGIKATNLSSAVAGRDTLFSSTLKNILSQLMVINEGLGRLDDVQAQWLANAPNLSLVQTHQPAAVAPAVSPPTTASTLAGCLLNWYTNHIWQTVKGKKEPNKRAEANVAVNI